MDHENFKEDIQCSNIGKKGAILKSNTADCLIGITKIFT